MREQGERERDGKADPNGNRGEPDVLYERRLERVVPVRPDPRRAKERIVVRDAAVRGSVVGDHRPRSKNVDHAVTCS